MDKESRVKASAPGKIIILGEHFVVHNSLAISAAINKRASVSIASSNNNGTTISSDGEFSRLEEDDGKFVAVKAVAKEFFRYLDQNRENLTIEIESQIPTGSGLGSSAAVSVACAAALTKYYDKEMDLKAISTLANEGESKVHGNPSGIDVATSLTGGTILFNRKNGFRSLNTNCETRFLVVFSDIERSTSELIRRVSDVRGKYPSTFQGLTDSTSKFCELAAEAVEKGDLSLLGAMMNLAQTSLCWIGASTSFIESLIERINQIGPCYGAKLTGAGGGGSVIALPQASFAEKIAVEISKEHDHTFLTNLCQDGLRIH